MNKIHNKYFIPQYIQNLKKIILIISLFSFHEVATPFQNNDDLDKLILEYNEKADDYIQDGNQNAAVQLYNQLAFSLRGAERYQEAAGYYQKVLEINTSLGNRRGQMIAHNSLAVVSLESENYQKAIFHFKKELEFRKQINNKADIINVLTNIALAENSLSNFDSAIEDIEQAISLANELNELSLLRRCYGVAYDIYDKKGLNEKARNYFEMYSALDRKLKEQKMTEITNEADRKVNIAYTEKELTEEKLSTTSEELEKTVTTLQKAEKLTREQQLEIELSQLQIKAQNALIETEKIKSKYKTYGISILSLFVIALTWMILKILKANKKINQQKLKLEKQHKEIRASIRYAQTIQHAMLPAVSEIEKYFEPFLLYRPKDIVSGDFYWFSALNYEKTETVFFAVVDCTGHGVPGAFMSMIGNRLMNEIVTEKKITTPSMILFSLNEMVRLALRQEETDNNDGMDLAFFKMEKQSKDKYLLTFSGAKRPLYIIQNNHNKLVSHPGDRKSIGGYSLAKKEIHFTDHQIEVEKGDMIYMFSDGIIDQNNPERKKFGRLLLEEAMIDCAKLDPSQQKIIIEERLNNFMQNEEQRDDITLIGLKII
jgi:serine phosphatase RsbU (regulator of sigma subunit)